MLLLLKKIPEKIKIRLEIENKIDYPMSCVRKRSKSILFL